ncbi:MAG: histidine phosphatase family protein [Flavisolibacter sp.]|nr:histidine phosphatase family protein [Flavisolibacter sp.]
MTRFLIFIIIGFTSCTTTHYYVVRHAEKEYVNSDMMSTDVPLTKVGWERAEALKTTLENKKIQRIFSTSYIRTTSTAKPLSDAIGVQIEYYNPRDSLFIGQLINLKQNVLVVGHSNTIDDLVNGLTGTNHLQDLPETQYGDLFVIKKKGSKIKFQHKKFGD